MSRVTICDVGPRDGLQNQPVTLAPAVRAELVDRLAAAGRAAHRGGQLRQPEGACRRWPAPRRSSRRSTRRDGRRLRGPRAQRARLRPAARDRPRRGALRLRGHGGVQPAQRSARRSTRVVAAAERIVERATRRRHPRDRHDRRRVRLPLRGRRRPGPRRASSPRELAGAGADEIVLADTIGVGVPRQVRDLVGARRAGSACRSGCTCTTRATPASRTRTRRSRRARPCSTPRSAASAAARSRPGRPGTSPPRISSTSCTARASRRASTSAR